MEEKITFTSGDLTLEGLYHEGTGDSGVVITHPHPLYGGDMYNHVVESIQLAFSRKDYSTLRFNFRGTGNSGGRFDEGRAEQDDLGAAAAWLKSTASCDPWLTGYSFGAWVIAGAMQAGLLAEAAVMVSPPVAFLDFSTIGRLEPLRLVISGSRDEFAPPERVRLLLPRWNADAVLEMIDGADHFYSGYTRMLEEMIARHV